MEKKQPERRCTGCMKSFPKKDLLRIASKDGKPVIDAEANMPGRGCYICKNENCAALAIKKNAFQRSINVSMDKEESMKFADELKTFINQN